MTKQTKYDVVTCESGQLTSGATDYREEQGLMMCGPDNHYFCITFAVLKNSHKYPTSDLQNSGTFRCFLWENNLRTGRI